MLARNVVAGVAVIRLLVSFTLAAGAVAARAQGQPAESQRSSIRGTVRDSLGFPVSGASVLITPGGSIHRTDSAGSFYARSVPSGRVTISIRRFGFAPIRSTVSARSGTESTVDLLMRRLPQLLPEVEVAVSNECPRFAIEGILCRREAGVGVFLNREDILGKIEGIQLVNLLLRDVPGFRPDSGGVAVNAESVMGSRCWGLVVDGGFPISSRPVRSVREVYALEVFRPADIPPEFVHWNRSQPGQNGATACAVVVMWSTQEAQRSLRRLDGERR